jgi:hypothetical protein
LTVPSRPLSRSACSSPVPEFCRSPVLAVICPAAIYLPAAVRLLESSYCDGADPLIRVRAAAIFHRRQLAPAVCAERNPSARPTIQ